MALPVATKNIILKWLQDRCPALKCAACSATSFDINEIVVCQPKAAPVGTLAGRGPTTEYVPLICAKCGYSMFFSVKVLGLTI